MGDGFHLFSHEAHQGNFSVNISAERYVTCTCNFLKSSRLAQLEQTCVFLLYRIKENRHPKSMAANLNILDLV